MKLTKIADISNYNNLIDKYSSIKLYTNNYIYQEVGLLISNDKLYEMHTDLNLFLFVKKDIGYRVYYYIGCENEVIDISKLDNLVVEILYRGDKFYPKAEIDYLFKCGFRINLIRDQYCGVYRDLEKLTSYLNINIDYAQDLEEVERACLLFNESFDALSGDYISSKSYNELYMRKDILIAKNLEGKFLGALHQTLEKGVAWISHIAVNLDSRGMHVGQALLDRFVQNNFTTDNQRYMFWVQQQNDVAVNMYKKKGFKYLNKSTISMIKK